MLAALLALATLGSSSPVDETVRVNLSEAIFHASVEASGSKLCDRQLSARYTREFEKRYGRRIKALMEYYTEVHGPDPDFIITTECRRSRASRRAQDRWHAQALKMFDVRLRELERRFGPGTDVR